MGARSPADGLGRDTYFQFMLGQSFNITGLPNGCYYARVHVNPLGSLYETNMSNNVESR